MPKSIIIIGAGIAGLAAGCYAQMNGFRSKIFELHDLPGGLCTAWERNGYIFDGCIHYLFGSSPGQPFYRVWEELGAVQNRAMIHHNEFMRITDRAGKTLIVYSDPDRLESHMIELSPADARLIESFIHGIRTFRDFDMSMLQEQPRSIMGPNEWRDFGLKVLPFARPLARWGMTAAQDFGESFEDPFLRRAVPLMFAWPECPVMVGQSLLAYLDTRNAGFPAGGSLEFARALERRYLDLGGEIQYKSQVQKIQTENGRAVGVLLYDDSEHQADYVISAADGRGTIFDLLGGQFVNKDIKRTYDSHLPIHSMVQVSLGVNRDLSGEPHWVQYLLEEPLTIGGIDHDTIGVKHYCFDPSLAPAGKSVVIVMLKTDYYFWQRIYGRKLYDTEQSQVCELVTDFLEQIYPGISDHIEVKDVATPLSYERYTGNWLGSTCGWLLTKDTMRLMIQGLSKTLPGLENFYMAGQWVEPGGSVPVVAMSGRNAIQLICHQEGQTFVSATHRL
jgi:phytoene dehydrogenase-like protein